MGLRMFLAGALALGLVGPALAEEPVKYKFAAKRTPAAMEPAPFGKYNRGCLSGGVELPETGFGWQAMRLSRNRNWGHPQSISFIQRLAAKAQDIGWAGLYIGDISQPRGGPMRSGHRSHQMGLDIDIWLRQPKTLGLSRAERERISSHVVTTGSGLGVNGYWTSGHHAVVKAAASDPAVARIFVHAAIKRAMCDAEPAGAGREWLRKIRPWYGHNAHFHVRLKCPIGATACVGQAAIPAGDGCGASLDWWFSDEARNPKPKKKKTKPRELVLADLPKACAVVLSR